MMDKNNLARTKPKFETEYFVAKQQLPMTKYEKLLNWNKCIA